MHLLQIANLKGLKLKETDIKKGSDLLIASSKRTNILIY